MAPISVARPASFFSFKLSNNKLLPPPPPLHLHYYNCLHYPLHSHSSKPNPSPKPATINITNNKSRDDWRLGNHHHLKSSSNGGGGSSCSDVETITRSPSLVELEYADLNLKDIYGRSQVGHVRIRQHVNPLSSSFSKPVAAPDWKQVFEDCTLPLMVDIGCGSGRFLLWLANYSSVHSRNYLGLEIRQKLVQRSQLWVKELGLRNIHFIRANATVSFDQLVSTYPGHLTFVSILCPDPHFKKRHHKRRVLQESLVDSISRQLKTGGQVLMQSDVLELAVDMRRQFDSRSDVLKHVDAIDNYTRGFLCDSDGWLMQNPMGKRTEREIHAELEGAKIYRRFYEKRK